MRIYKERIPVIAQKIVRDLVSAELIEVDAELLEEVELDMASVLTEYRNQDYRLGERARDIVSMRNLDYSHLYKIKSRLAAEARFGLNDEGIEWIANQMIEILLQSSNVEEIFGEDHELRRLIGPVLKKELGMEEALDAEVKRRIKNLQEGTTDYEIEYKKAMDAVRGAKSKSSD